MGLRVKAVERLLKFTNDPKDPGVYRYVMKPEMYSTLNGLLRVTVWHCPDWVTCASDCEARLWRT